MTKEAIKLPLNCTAEYIEEFLSNEISESLYKHLIDDYRIENQRIEININNEKTYTDTGKIMFVDESLYSENKLPEAEWGKTAIWSKELKIVKKKIEDYTGLEFNVCVCIYYPNGNAGVDFHSDYIAFGDTTVIPSISLGEEREFHLREKESFEIFDIVLKEGSMLIMGENCQERYEHSLPFNPKYKNGRINLTFRKYGFDN